MSKYIIDIPNGIEWGVVTCRTEDGFYTRDFDSLEELNSDYINEHFGDLQDTAYQRGLEEGKKATFGLVADASNAEYQKGFEDGKAVNDKGCEGCMYNDGTKEHSPCDICCNAYLNRWTAKPQEDDKIEVGDEVIYNGTTKCLVVRPETDERYAVLIDSNGNHHHADHSECKKTGRHFDIQSILEAMKA